MRRAQQRLRCHLLARPATVKRVEANDGSRDSGRAAVGL